MSLEKVSMGALGPAGSVRPLSPVTLSLDVPWEDVSELSVTGMQRTNKKERKKDREKDKRV